MIEALRYKVRALFRRRRVERELDEELAFHLEREIHKQMASGVGAAEARTRALARFGSVALAADECRDARGTAFIDGLVRDVLYAFRTFRRAPLGALTIIVTVALGLGMVAVVFMFLNVLVFRVDEVLNPEELFAVERPDAQDGRRVLFTHQEYEALRRDTSVFTDAFAMVPIGSRIEGREMTGRLVSGNFFDVLGVRAELGRTLVPADDHASARPVMVLSHRGWSQHFANDPRVIGRPLLVNGVSFEIVGVMAEGFRGLMVAPPHYWAPLALQGHFRRLDSAREAPADIDIVGRLKPGLSQNAALSALVAWDSRRAVRDKADRHSAGIKLEPRRGTIRQPIEAAYVFTPLFFVFGLILVIACANVANLLLARAVSRQREIGIRSSLGASRGRIVRQLLTESLLLALASAALGFVISRLAMHATAYAVISTVPAEIGVEFSPPSADWRVALFLIGGAITSTVFFALAPAMRASRPELVRTIRGEVAKDARPGRARSVLICLQVTASALLLTSSAVFLRSALSAATADPGVRTSDTVIVEIDDEESRATMVQAVVAEPYVASTAASWPDLFGGPHAGFAEAGGTKSSVGYKFVSPEYFAVLDIDIVRGRGFTQAERSPDAGVAVVSETVARQLWPTSDPLGQTLRVEANPDSESRRAGTSHLLSRAFTVVGISRHATGFRIAFNDFREAGIFVPIDATASETSLTVRVHGDAETARRALLQRLTAIDPDYTGDVMTLRSLARIGTYVLQIAFWVTLVLGGLALVLTLSGLFSVLSYLVEQRRREIGVRMAIGATTRNVGWMVLSQSVYPVGAGLIVGSGLAAAIGLLLMATPAAARIADRVRVFDPIAYLTSLLLIVIACAFASLIPALRAAHIDPVAVLKQD